MIDMLRVARGNGVLKTHLMYRSNVSHRMLVTYIDYLAETGLIEWMSNKAENYGSQRISLRTTKKGERFLLAYDSLIELSGGLGRIAAFSGPRSLDPELTVL